MSLSNYFENQLAEWIANGGAAPTIGSSIFRALHTADPGEAGTQLTNEAALADYPEYARQSVTRGTHLQNSSGIWINPVEWLWPTSSSPLGPYSLWGWSLGFNASGSSEIIIRGAFNTPLILNPTIAPRILANGLNVITN